MIRNCILFSALLLVACSSPGQESDPYVTAAIEEIRSLQFQPTCETTERPEGEPYWTFFTTSDGSERLEFHQSPGIGSSLYLTTDWPADFTPSDMGDVQCRTAMIANEAARILESYGLPWRLIEVQAVQTAGMRGDQVRLWGRQEKRPVGSEFITGR